MGLPKIQIEFKALANSLMLRTGRGKVLLIKRATSPALLNASYLFDDILKTKVKVSDTASVKIAKNESNASLSSGAREVFFEFVTTANTLDLILEKSKKMNVDYIAFTGATDDENTAIVNFVKAERLKGSIIKAVLYNTAADDEGIINFATEKVTVKKYSDISVLTDGNAGEIDGTDFTGVIAGVIAGQSFEGSTTYKVLKGLSDVSQSADLDADVDAGKLILINDGEKIKIARGVNSLTTIKDGQNDEYKKIKLVEGMDVIKKDIKKSFRDNFVGKVTNNLDNKNMFINTINLSYFKKIEGTILNDDFENKIELDLKAIKDYLISANVDVSAYSDIDFKKANTGSTLFVKGKIKLLDAIEDLTLNFEI